jgi:hypothetical protein
MQHRRIPADELDNIAPVNVSLRLRDKLNRMIEQLFHTGKRCELAADGTERKPKQTVLLEAAWEVALRHPGELQSAIMRRTELRKQETGVRIDYLASGHRPR